MAQSGYVMALLSSKLILCGAAAHENRERCFD